MVITCYIGALCIELGDISEGFLCKFYVSLVIKKEGRIYGYFFGNISGLLCMCTLKDM